MDTPPFVRFIIDTNLTPPSFLPPNVDPNSMMDITKAGDRYRVYMAADGTIHDGNVYFNEYRAQQARK